MENVKPSLEEVKEHFKNAKTVSCLIRNKKRDIVNNLRQGIHKFNDGYWVDTASSNVKVWDSLKGYAKILSYKKPKFEITKDQILLLKEKCKKGGVSESRLKEWFPEVFETVFNTGYYKHKNGRHPEWLSYANFKTKEHYGRGGLGDWFHGNAEYHLKYITSNCEPMSTEEVTEALKKEAVERGFKLGAYIVRDFDDDLKDVMIDMYSHPHDKNWFYHSEDDYLERYGFVVYSKGQWAEIIPTKTIKEAEELLKELGHNFKIV